MERMPAVFPLPRRPGAAAAAAMAVLAVAALAAAPAALAHGGNAVSKLYLSEVTSIQRTPPGVSAVVLGRDDRLEIANPQKATFVILGYENEPYLRFSPKGVEVNVHSPAEYLNNDRFAKVSLPREADAKLAPAWTTLTLGSRWSFHDHRIHWMSTTLPPVAKAAPKRPQLVFYWKVPFVLGPDAKAAGAARGAVQGQLTYVPPKSGVDTGLIVGIALPVGVVLVAGAATGLLLLRRRRQAAGE